jgi:hypothetical protein
MLLQEISFPVFRLGEKRPTIDAGVTFFMAEYSDKDSAKYSSNYRIVDDKNIDKPTLGLRRLMLAQKVSLFPIGSAIYFLADLIKLAKSTTWFVDNTGQVFQHKKSTRAKLTTKKIKQVLPASTLGCVIEVDGLSQRFKSMQPPQAYQKYAGLLEISGGHILYGFYETQIKDTWRLV